METLSPGIHHITAISSDPQGTLDFYSGLLGLRLVKKTVNYDDPGTYHLYFGDRRGSPGGILTFFPWGAGGGRGRRAAGQVSTIAFSIPAAAMDFWRARLSSFGLEIHGPVEGEHGVSIGFRDPDGLSLELVDAGSKPSSSSWDEAVPEDRAILGFHSVTLSVRKPEHTAEVLRSALGFRALQETADSYLMAAVGRGLGGLAQVVADRSEGFGRMGAGVVHHIAWRAVDDAAQARLRSQVVAAGMDATPVIDRSYFRSVYFREPGGILFEIATDPPGFSIDESPDSLGSRLALPPWLEDERSSLEEALTPLRAPRAERSLAGRETAR